MKARVVRRALPAAAPILNEAALHPVLRRVYAARGITAIEQLDQRLTRLADPVLLGGLDHACALLAAAIVAQQSILIVGDFDADGATGTAVAIRGLGLLGAQRVAFRVPNRAIHGYGLSPALVAELALAPPQLLITVDNGIACHAGVQAALALGCRVIITDHHVPGSQLPAADAVVNPNLPGDGFPSKALAGVGVMFYLLLALRAHLRGSDFFSTERPEPDLSVLLDLVAIGTVADLVPLDFNNRVLVAAGLRRIQAGRAAIGVNAIIRAAGRDPARIDAADLGFVVGPRINAAGRLEDMSIGIHCLLSESAEQAQILAARLDGINAERRGVQAEMVAEAEAWLQHFHPDHAQLPPALCLFDATWHPGVIGLVASRIKDRVHRPTIAFAPAATDGRELRGSARSIPGLHLRDALAAVDARHPGWILKFGGHAMAAGLSLQRQHFDRFAAAFAEVVRERVDPAWLEALLYSDGTLADDDCDLALACALRAGGPWGQGFPEPLFDGEFQIESARLLGTRHLALKLRCCQSARVFEAVHFGAFTGQLPSGRWHYAYQVQVDEWRNQHRLRLLIRQALPVLAATAS
ncbi:MAG: single-stranded-DNA-specific exonuclease RecJ [Lysobacterales bacterium CG02_land_8_20_14_3_00_62_12]|nr:MAG: single-stranded-DNA-specific exonuclease RecJ [Xanthomonadales bacterium CG02_land_8_20_14_3_00_62_12]